MYLIKMELPLSAPKVRAALLDSQKMHQLVTGFFGTRRKDAELLYRCRPRGAIVDLYMYAEDPLALDRLFPGARLVGQRDVTPWLDAMEAGRIYGFQLQTMPFKKVAEEGAKNSRRRALRTPEERLAWLSRKAEQGGFQILSAGETPGDKVMANHPAERGGSLTMDTVCFSGRLQITDADAFRRTIREGVGPGRAYGLGMLLLSGNK